MTIEVRVYDSSNSENSPWKMYSSEEVTEQTVEVVTEETISETVLTEDTVTNSIEGQINE